MVLSLSFLISGKRLHLASRSNPRYSIEFILLSLSFKPLKQNTSLFWKRQLAEEYRTFLRGAIPLHLFELTQYFSQLLKTCSSVQPPKASKVGEWAEREGICLFYWSEASSEQWPEGENRMNLEGDQVVSRKEGLAPQRKRCPPSWMEQMRIGKRREDWIYYSVAVLIENLKWVQSRKSEGCFWRLENLLGLVLREE